MGERIRTNIVDLILKWERVEYGDDCHYQIRLALNYYEDIIVIVTDSQS